MFGFISHLINSAGSTALNFKQHEFICLLFCHVLLRSVPIPDTADNIIIIAYFSSRKSRCPLFIVFRSFIVIDPKTECGNTKNI